MVQFDLKVMPMNQYDHYIFDWGNTLMEDLPGQQGSMFTWPEVKVVEGAADCLIKLAPLARCHVATNAQDSTAIEIRKAFAIVGLSQFIEEIFCFNSIGHKKPSSEYFEFIHNRLSAPKSKIVVIGDSLENDIYGALAHGFNAIWFNRNGDTAPSDIQAITKLGQILMGQASSAISPSKIRRQVGQ